MKIKKIKTWSENMGNTKPYTIAFKTVDQVCNVFVEITLANGITGLGAGNPNEYVTGENLDMAVAALDEKNTEFLIGRDIRSTRQLLFEINEKFSSTPAAQAALDIAIYDAFSQWLGIPLVKYLGQKIYSMETSITIGIKNLNQTLTEAEDYGKMGFKVLKVKIGKDIEEDIERLVKLREKFGNRFRIRIDANQGYTPQQTIEFYKKTLSLNLELIEQPLPAKAISDLRKLPAEVRKVIASDESLISPQNALTLASPEPASGIFNIKLMKCGGIHQALSIANIASLSKVDLFWGCNDESIISITAALHVAFSCSNTKYIDLDGSLDLANDIVKGGFILKNGVMSCSELPGIGVERKT